MQLAGAGFSNANCAAAAERSAMNGTSLVAGVVAAILVLIAAIGFAASRRGKSPLYWAFYGLLTSLVGLWPLAAVALCIETKSVVNPRWGRMAAGMFLIVAFFGAVATGIAIALGPGEFYRSVAGGFTDQDVASVKESIKSEYEKRPGVHVTDVTMIHDGNSKLTGFVKVRVDGVDDANAVTTPCSATMGDGQLVWTCR